MLLETAPLRGRELARPPLEEGVVGDRLHAGPVHASPPRTQSRRRTNARWRTVRTLSGVSPSRPAIAARGPLLVERLHEDGPLPLGEPRQALPQAVEVEPEEVGLAAREGKAPACGRAARRGGAVPAAGSRRRGGRRRGRRRPAGRARGRAPPAGARGSAGARPGRGRPPTRRPAGGGGRRAAPGERGGGRAPSPRPRVRAPRGHSEGQLPVGRGLRVSASSIARA